MRRQKAIRMKTVYERHPAGYERERRETPKTEVAPSFPVAGWGKLEKHMPPIFRNACQAWLRRSPYVLLVSLLLGLAVYRNAEEAVEVMILANLISFAGCLIFEPFRGTDFS